MPAPPRPPDGPRRPPWWRRSRLPYALALVVVLPLAGGLPAWLEYRSTGNMGQRSVPAPVVDGDTTELAGSTWELRNAIVPSEPQGEAATVDGLAEVAALFAIQPGDDDASDVLTQRCRFRAVDDQGRVWNTDSADPMTPDNEVGTNFGLGCADMEGDPIPAGEEQLYLVVFTVPEDAVDTLALQVEVATNTPDYETELDEDGLPDLDSALEWDPELEAEVDWEPRPIAATFLLDLD